MIPVFRTDFQLLKIYRIENSKSIGLVHKSFLLFSVDKPAIG